MIRDTPDGRVLSVLTPLKAGHDVRGADCISCHTGSKGDILGAVRVDYSLASLDAVAKPEPVAPKAVAQPAPVARAKPVPMAGVDDDDEWEEF